jgi:CBS domain-containing protein
VSSVRELATGARRMVSLPLQASIREAIATMASHDISAVTVLEGDAPVGTVTERDLVRKALKVGYVPERVHEVMTRRPITVSPADSTDAFMALMIENHVRHLPVLEDGRLVGCFPCATSCATSWKKRSSSSGQMSD